MKKIKHIQSSTMCHLQYVPRVWFTVHYSATDNTPQDLSILVLVKFWEFEFKIYVGTSCIWNLEAWKHVFKHSQVALLCIQFKAGKFCQFMNKLSALSAHQWWPRNQGKTLWVVNGNRLSIISKKYFYKVEIFPQKYLFFTHKKYSHTNIYLFTNKKSSQSELKLSHKIEFPLQWRSSFYYCQI